MTNLVAFKLNFYPTKTPLCRHKTLFLPPKSTKMTRLLPAVAALLVSTQIFAQEKALDSVAISGRLLATPYSKVVENVTVITKAQIAQTPATAVEDLLQYYAGIDVRRRGPNGVQSDLSIRGGTFEQVLLLLNGIRMNDAQTGHNTMNLPVSLQDIERIEIFKGPAARRYGSNAFSGVINIITRPSSQGQLRVAATGGDFSSWSLATGATFGKEGFQNLLHLNTSASEGYRYNTDFVVRNAYYHSRIRTGSGNLNVQAGFVEKKFGANGFYSSPNAIHQYEETQASLVSADYQNRAGKFFYSLNAYWRRGQDMYQVNRRNPGQYRNLSIGNNVGADFSAGLENALGVAQVGVSGRREFLSSHNANTFTTKNWSVGHQNRTVVEAFAEQKFGFFDQKLTVVPGISWSNIGGKNYFYPGLDAGYLFGSGHKIYGNVAKVNRVPSFFDLYYISSTELGNPDLQPESALAWEAGYQFLWKGTEMKASYFVRDSKNGIDWIRNSPQEVWRSQNVGNLKTSGVDAEVRQMLPVGLGRATVGYTYLNIKLVQTAQFSKYLAENFRHQLVAKWEATFGRKFSSTFSYRYQERASGESYVLLDEKLAYKTQALTLYALVNNLTNRAYREAFGVPMPGRWFHVGFEYALPLGK